MGEVRFIFQANKLWLHPGAVPQVQAEATLRLPEGIMVQRVAADHPLPQGVEALGLRDCPWSLMGRERQMRFGLTFLQSDRQVKNRHLPRSLIQRTIEQLS